MIVRFLLPLLACSSLLTAAPARRVVMISLDGVPARLVADPRAGVPTLRELATRGVMAEGMRPTNPTTTWSNHTTLVTGVAAAEHGVLFNGVMNTTKAGWPPRYDADTNRADLLRPGVETLYDAARAAGMKTAAIDWPATGAADTLDDNMPDRGHGIRETTPALRRELQDLLRDETGKYFDTLSAPARDQIWLQAAIRVIERRKPELLLLHLLNTDGMHHRYGAGSYASLTAVALADRFVRDVLDALRRAGVFEETTVLIVSDHGFSTPANEVAPNVVLAQHGWLKASSVGMVVDARAYVVSNGGSGILYLRDPADRVHLPELAAWFSATEGIARVLSPADFAAEGWPTPEQHAGMGALVLRPKSNFGVVARPTGEVTATLSENERRGHHGYLADEPEMRALFIAAGRGIRSGAKLGVIENRDVAPTVAALLGLKLPKAQGKVLREILE